ncbi:MAG: Gfo/Idh/MocA family oxidoreductase, partial [Phycisphaeraceae bacterium]
GKELDMSDSPKTVRWGIVSTGAIAKTYAKAIADAEHAELTAVASRTREQADAFGEEFGVPERFASYEAMFASDACDAVYIATPHTSHARLAILAAEAGKHVFVEKPAAVNRFELDAAIEAARQNGVYFAEAFKERRHPVVHKLLEVLRDKPIGEIQIIRSHFGFGMGRDISPDSRLGNPDLAGGGVLDVGCYALNLARLLAGAAAPDPQPFLSPTSVKAVARMAPTGVDQASSAVLAFETGTLAELSCGTRTPGNIGLAILGDAGTITCPDPWANDREKGGTFTIELHPRGGENQTFTIDCPVTSFALEAEAASRDILAGRTEPEPPGMTWDDSRSNAEALDRWRAELRLTYPVETPEGFSVPIHGRPLARAADAPMTYSRIEGLDKPVSRMVMGCDNQTTFAQAAVMFAAWYECGGNAFDTAHIYHGGTMERMLGL